MVSDTVRRTPSHCRSIILRQDVSGSMERNHIKTATVATGKLLARLDADDEVACRKKARFAFGFKLKYLSSNSSRISENSTRKSCPTVFASLVRPYYLAVVTTGTGPSVESEKVSAGASNSGIG